MKQFLYKCSSPGWKKEVGSELEAKELLYSHICSTCRKELIYEQRHGEKSYADVVGEVLTPEQQALWDDTPMAQLHEVSITDLLTTACGFEYSYEEKDEY